MTRLNVLLLLAVLASALFLVHTQYRSRLLFTELDRVNTEARRLEIDGDRLHLVAHIGSIDIDGRASGRKQFGFPGRARRATRDHGAAAFEREEHRQPRQRLHYLSVPPKAALSVVETLRDADLVANSRIIMENPFGTDLESA